MANDHAAVTHTDAEAHGSLKSYTLGFIISLVLTALPVAIVLGDLMDGVQKKVVLMLAGVLQLVVQLVFFMHLREERKPRYNLMSLALGLFILIIIVAGSMWIMLYNTVAS
ncbi:cytochrome o ubiquinol oxidase subunit IV [Paenibacillus physcomitrellae]|uniref:Cytochrome o ubiquinol oxidase subunit IV n=1 Tax=Paenibacillus physcomitrellae TaxID=1619311 RepID=A0ABQ1G3V8_9BACL|nr:cytochrome o ubiquinol oxidase subunit IV [Paenibacillus physcomitrellae]GGA36942.1 cytochrome o ubiquinol oxidase subunit IV [Paenibacillus physcomitrellae]